MIGGRLSMEIVYGRLVDRTWTSENEMCQKAIIRTGPFGTNTRSQLYLEDQSREWIGNDRELSRLCRTSDTDVEAVSGGLKSRRT